MISEINLLHEHVEGLRFVIDDYYLFSLGFLISLMQIGFGYVEFGAVRSKSAKQTQKPHHVYIGKLVWVHRCRICKRPLNESDVEPFQVTFVNKKSSRKFFGADKYLVKLAKYDVLCNYCVVESKINSLLKEFTQEWAHDFRVASVEYDKISALKKK
ncbi:Hypothetical predicted protein [Cloeon dipterum]|uniref:Uncharacterized protein n=1 Tax=Cloeon dipterum TaxID=197152 RepID=A0A8S1D2W7_9INSE|nr:Hypothetical predicted protein [Cloeon dipterum]